MIKNLHNKHRHFHLKFLTIWIGLTVAFLLMVIFFQWQYIRTQKTHQLELNAHRLAFKFDLLIERVLESVHKLPFYLEETKSCEQLIPYLKSIVVDNYFAHAIVISDLNNKILCTTLEKNSLLPKSLPQTTVLFGPLRINGTLQDVFFLQQKLGQSHLGIYLLKPLFVSLFQNNGSDFDFIGLYDRVQKKIIFQMGNSFTNNALLTHKVREVTLDVDHNNQGDARFPLQNIDNIDLLLSTRSLNLYKQLLSNLPFIIVPTLLLSWLMYYYCRRFVRRRFSLAYALNHAIKSNQFYPVYQAVRDEAQDCFCGAEVLIRWDTDFNETIMPDYFIDEAEKSGLIIPITLLLIEEAFQECQQLFRNPNFHLAFNLSPSHFRDEEFFTKFYTLCSEYQISPHQLMLELTERELFNQSEDKVVEIMNELRVKGYSLALDDFGTGQANINYLHHFPFNYLKIDKIFINTIGTGALIENLNHAIIAMAKSLELIIIAEGVENQTQLDYLRANQVNYIQGWYYAKALPFDQFAKLMQHTHKESK